ncbi:MAG: hypothetical protein JSU79_10665 [Dehalococcoidales bacterium]|nr:MAG: hypothetical protein JSU79_10665 [Dehalococcoidales bacterium]
MEFNIGDKIKYQDVYGDSFKALIIDVWTNDDEEITGYFAVTNSGLYVHFKPDSLEWCHLEAPVPLP